MKKAFPILLTLLVFSSLSCTQGGGGSGQATGCLNGICYSEGTEPKDISGTYGVEMSMTENTCGENAQFLGDSGNMTLTQSGSDLSTIQIATGDYSETLNDATPDSESEGSSGGAMIDTAVDIKGGDSDEGLLTGTVAGNTFKAEGTENESLSGCTISYSYVIIGIVENNRVDANATVNLTASGNCGTSGGSCTVTANYNGEKNPSPTEAAIGTSALKGLKKTKGGSFLGVDFSGIAKK